MKTILAVTLILATIGFGFAITPKAKPALKLEQIRTTGSKTWNMKPVQDRMYCVEMVD